MTHPFWTAFGDIHDDLTRLRDIPDLAKAAGIILTGDLTLGGGVKQAERVLAGVIGKNPAYYAQIGNMDRPEITDFLEQRNCNLHGRAKELFPGVYAVGVGASPFTPFGTPAEFPESRLAEWMEQGLLEARSLWSAARQSNVPETTRLVLIAHAPPHATACDRLHNGTPVGSTAVREFIEEHQPDLCICGHIHEAKGTDRLGRTLIINTGTLGSGGYAVITRPDPNGPVTAELRSC